MEFQFSEALKGGSNLQWVGCGSGKNGSTPPVLDWQQNYQTTTDSPDGPTFQIQLAGKFRGQPGFSCLPIVPLKS